MSDIYCLVGLGNPGAKYARTRHNIGFMCIETLALRHGIALKPEKTMKAMVGRGRIHERSVLLVQPLTYMNCSGNALKLLLQYYKIPFEHVLVILDDIDLPFGRIRFRGRGSAGSHNGMKSVIDTLDTPAIPRLRVGVNAPPPQWDLADYVLSSFSPQEIALLPNVLDVCANAITVWLNDGIEKAMNQFNSLEILPASSEA